MEVPECNVCNETLDEGEHQPRHLGCSHDACTSCIKSLIRNGTLECPMCRVVIRVNKVEDLPINHGVIQVLRLFKGSNVSESEQVICKIHEQTVSRGCLTCKVWICVKCTEFHTQDIGCEVQKYNAFLKNSKKKHRMEVEPTRLSLIRNLDSLSTKFSELEIKKKALEEQMENVKKSIGDGKETLNRLESATANVDKADTAMELNKSMHTSNEWCQFSQIWCKKNHEIPNTPCSHMEESEDEVMEDSDDSEAEAYKDFKEKVYCLWHTYPSDDGSDYLSCSDNDSVSDSGESIPDSEEEISDSEHLSLKADLYTPMAGWMVGASAL